MMWFIGFNSNKTLHLHKVRRSGLNWWASEAQLWDRPCNTDGGLTCRTWLSFHSHSHRQCECMRSHQRVVTYRNTSQRLLSLFKRTDKQSSAPSGLQTLVVSSWFYPRWLKFLTINYQWRFSRRWIKWTEEVVHGQNEHHHKKRNETLLNWKTTSISLKNPDSYNIPFSQ